MKVTSSLVLAVFSTIVWTTQAYAQQIDPGTGLIESGDWQLVYANCLACHSLALVTAQRGDTNRWREIVREMQSSRNMWTLAPETEGRIIDYLAEQYPPDRAFGRRPPLLPKLLPKSSL